MTPSEREALDIALGYVGARFAGLDAEVRRLEAEARASSTKLTVVEGGKPDS